MALSPIQIFQQQQNPLAQILAGGNETITGIFDKAIQIGRDMSNKQLQQEQDMMAMRNAETNMAQRRAENLQQNNEDAIKFARGAFESDRKFGVDQTQQAFQNERVTAQDLFSNQQDTERMGLANQANDRANADQKMQVDAVAAEKGRLAAERARVNSLFPGQTDPTVTQAPPTNIVGAVDVGGMTSQNSMTRDQPSAATVLNPQTRGLPLAGALEIQLTQSATPEQKAQAAVVIANSKRNAQGQGNDGPTQAQQNANITFQQKQVERADEERNEKADSILVDNTVFPLHATDTSTMTDKGKVKEIETRDAHWNANQRAQEFSAALDYASPEDYAGSMDAQLKAQGKPALTTQQKKKRMEMWHLARDKPTATTEAPAAAEAPNPAKGYFATKRAPLQP